LISINTAGNGFPEQGAHQHIGPEPARRMRRSPPDKPMLWRLDMGRGLLLWLIGIPLPIILVIWLLGGLS
jgi:hypothetical protein